MSCGCIDECWDCEPSHRLQEDVIEAGFCSRAAFDMQVDSLAEVGSKWEPPEPQVHVGAHACVALNTSGRVTRRDTLAGSEASVMSLWDFA